MAKNMFDKWDNEVDVKGLADDVKAASENGAGTYEEVPHGEYEVSLEKLELTASKTKGDPMVTAWFKVVSEGSSKGSLIFMNQVITQGFQVHIVNEMLRAMVAEAPDAPEIEFVKFSQYAELLMDVFEVIDDNFEFTLKYSANKKGYNTFEIKEVFVLE